MRWQDMQKRLLRLRRDCRALQALTSSEIKSAYDDIEICRDLLSYLLDRADDK